MLERVEIRGNDRTDENAIRPYVPLRVGESLDVDDPRIETIRWRLLSTGWFDEVRLGLERGSERGRVVLVVEVSERNTFVVQGIAFGISEGVLNSDDASVLASLNRKLEAMRQNELALAGRKRAEPDRTHEAGA